MAEQLKAVDGGKADDAPEEGGTRLNSAARKQIIRSTFEQAFDLEMQIADLTAQHIQKFKDEKTKLWREAKADLDITRKILDAQYKNFKLAKQAQLFDDENDSAKAMDDMKEVFQALHPGQVVDWVDIVGSQESVH